MEEETRKEGLAPDARESAGPVQEGEKMEPPGVNPPEADKKKKGNGRFFNDGRVWAGIGIGALIVILLGGMFAIGFAVGRCGGGEDGMPHRGAIRENVMPLDTMRDKMEQKQEARRDLLGDYSDEIKETVAATLGMSAEDMQKELDGGKSLLDIAGEKGVSEQDLAKAVSNKVNEIADELVAEGRITEEQAEKFKENSEKRALNLIEKRAQGPGPMPDEGQGPVWR